MLTHPLPQVFDKEGNGWIISTDLRHVLSNIGEKLSPAEVRRCMGGLHGQGAWAECAAAYGHARMHSLPCS